MGGPSLLFERIKKKRNTSPLMLHSGGGGIHLCLCVASPKPSPKVARVPRRLWAPAQPTQARLADRSLHLLRRTPPDRRRSLGLLHMPTLSVDHWVHT